jgi:hypothetical protein
MRNAIVFAAAVLTATAAYAQAPPPAPTNGPLVLEQIHDGWILAPDFKVTNVDNRTGELAGAYGGRLIDGTILIGAAGYGLTNQTHDFRMGYGGLLFGVQTPELGRIRFGGRALLGAGQATLGFDVTTIVPPPSGPGQVQPGDIRFGVPSAASGTPAQPPQTIRAHVIGRDNFMVFEPTASISARLTSKIGVSCGVGYRLTSQTGFLRDQLNGATANLALQFGF